MTASSRGWTPTYLNAEPHRTGVSLRSSAALRIASMSSATGISAPSRISSATSSS